MFYSQFILAKKGPLGTIWIAAHLERKLRKNQVADTDIGVSVDSILFPEVPIALRLSSHLLLGVVRIYSRKVNYLFDDCSEALLNIKQAFRSTAVDLPPEESKAPYHSITLPETFDLDDFELPDNDIFQGNYVDHHISAREQITLQDNMEGVVYSTSQFGLDERFGDGDTSGLDLDEELFLEKVDAAGLAGISADPQASIQPTVPLKQDEDDGGMLANPDTRIEVATPDGDLMDYAQAPCTPGLAEEPNLSNVQETSACDDHIEFEDNNLMESSVKQKLQNISGKSNLQGDADLVDWSLPDDMKFDVVHIPFEENGYHSGHQGFRQGQSPSEIAGERGSLDHPTSVSGTTFGGAEEVPVVCQEPNLTDEIPVTSDREDRIEELQNGILKVDGIDGPVNDLAREDHGNCNGISSKESAEDTSYFASGSQQVPERVANNNQTRNLIEESNNVEIPETSERPFSPRGIVDLRTELKDTSILEKPENLVYLEPTDSRSLLLHDEMQHAEVHILRPCDASLGELNPSHAEDEHPNNVDTPSNVGVISQYISEAGETNYASGTGTMVQGQQGDAVDESKHILEENHVNEPALLEDFHVGSSKSDDQVNNGFGQESRLENPNGSASIDFPAPEKLLSAPDGFGDQPRNFLEEATPGDLAGVDESDAGSRIVSGKKRSYTESTLTEQSLNSVESSRVVRAKKTIEAIPDDDDLLSSILVGRKSSLLKVKPSPPREITSLKRHRSAPRPSASKRRVLMDDTMVLHGDTIRQQLTITEDIRRLRKKAPCTRPEISMIQKQFLEDEIFGEPICSGLSTELASLHNQPYDLSGIIVSEDDVSGSALLNGTDTNITSGNEENICDFGVQHITGSERPHVTVEKDMDGIAELAVGSEIFGEEACETHVLVESKLDEDHVCAEGANIIQVQMKPTLDAAEAPELSTSQLEDSQNLAENEVGGSSSMAQAVDPAIPVEIEPSDRASGDLGDDLVDTIQTTSLDENSADAPIVPSDEKSEIEDVVVDASVIGEDHAKVDYEKDGTVNGDDAFGATIRTARDDSNQGVESNTSGPPVETETDVGRVDYSDQLFDDIYGEQPIVSSSHPTESATVQDSVFYDEEYPILHDAYPANVVDAEISDIDMHTHDGLNYSAAGDETEFLNFDDDEVAEVTDDHTPSAEEIRFTENSGWSSRTRAVAKYLQTLFIKEAEYGRKTLPMDNLLVGKTRKEASRMFFEALVLKTRDYIHVEQEYPFDNISIKPRMKLTKSDF